MEHASLAGPTTHGPAFYLQHALWAARGSGDPGIDPGIEPADEPPPGIDPGIEPADRPWSPVPPRGPPPHDWRAPRQPGTAMARMQQLGGAKFEDFKRHDLELLATFVTNVTKH